MRAGMGGISIAAILLILGIVMLVIVVAVIVVLAVVLSKGSKSKNMPQVTVNAFVIGKRENVTPDYIALYYVAFQFENGERVELCVDGASYGVIVEGDRGLLTFQGTRFLGFQRNY